MKLVNLTPHPITLQLPDGTRQTIPVGGPAARVATKTGEPYSDPGLPIPVVPAPKYGPVEGLPAPAYGVAYLVSLMVLDRVSGRNDVFAPGTGPNDGCIRDEKGQIQAVTRLIAARLP